MASPIHILGISGSLRHGSWNTKLLRAAKDVLPPDATLDIQDLAEIPLYNADVEAGGFPEPIERFRNRITAADALLIASPEYNYSVTGVLKNALDWASRPVPAPRAAQRVSGVRLRRPSPLSGKPVAMMGAGGRFGTVRAQLHLRIILTECEMLMFSKPELMVPRPADKFDSEGRLADEETRNGLTALVEALVAWTRRLRGG